MFFLRVIFNLFRSGYQEIRFRFYYGPIFHRFLNHKYPYYTKLPWKLKMKFLRLVRDHYEYFEFISRDHMKLTRAMKAIICSAASQLVLFLPPESLTYFEKIIVYSDYYQSRITHRRHKGEVNPGMKLIVFSWRGIAEGMKILDDGINLLLHEFAHALWLEHKLMGHIYDVLDPVWVKKFEAYAVHEMTNLNLNENHFFRKYAFENMEEFFAVAVENFFERPDEFQKQQGDLYFILKNLFRQDPIALVARNVGKTNSSLNFAP